jgi:hypothetical protein
MQLPFYVEVCMEQFDFIELFPTEKREAVDTERFIAEATGRS